MHAILNRALCGPVPPVTGTGAAAGYWKRRRRKRLVSRCRVFGPGTGPRGPGTGRNGPRGVRVPQSPPPGPPAAQRPVQNRVHNVEIPIWARFSCHESTNHLDESARGEHPRACSTGGVYISIYIWIRGLRALGGVGGFGTSLFITLWLLWACGDPRLDCYYYTSATWGTWDPSTLLLFSILWPLGAFGGLQLHCYLLYVSYFGCQKGPEVVQRGP